MDTADSRLFGFQVGRLTTGDIRKAGPAIAQFGRALHEWALAREVELISSAAPADDALWAFFLIKTGFTPVDLSVQVYHGNLASLQQIRENPALHEAGPEDREEALEIAGTSFRHGRFHTDARFPLTLAHLRYREWVARGLEKRHEGHRVFVLGETGRIRGMMYAVLDGDMADLRLGALHPSRQSGLDGYFLYAGALAALRGMGAGKAVSRPQLSNPRVLNIYAALGFQFSDPHQVYHWHLPESRHLVAESELWKR